MTSITMHELQEDDIVFYYWTKDSRANRSDCHEVRSVRLTQRLQHWDEGAFAIGAIVNTLFVLIDPYDRDYWHKTRQTGLHKASIAIP